MSDTIEVDNRIPVNIITGFLGSGKTTLLNQWVNTEEFKDTLVLINEFGDVGLDHELVQAVDDTVVLLGSGCICLLYTSPSPRDRQKSRMPSSA